MPPGRGSTSGDVAARVRRVTEVPLLGVPLLGGVEKSVMPDTGEPLSPSERSEEESMVVASIATFVAGPAYSRSSSFFRFAACVRPLTLLSLLATLRHLSPPGGDTCGSS